MKIEIPDAVQEFLYEPGLAFVHPVHTDPSRYVRVASRILVPASVCGDLAPWDREVLRGLAAVRSSNKAVLSGRAAARLWGLSVYSPDREAFRAPVQLVVPGNTRPTSKKLWAAGVVYSSSSLPDSEYVEVEGYRVVTAYRAVRDIIVQHAEPLPGLVALDSLRYLQDEHSDEDCVGLVLGGRRRYAGKARVRQVAGLSIPNSESALETWGRYQLLEAKLSEVKTIKPQQRIRIAGQIYRVDLLVNDYVVVEFDGLVKYRENDQALRAEAHRQHALANAGFHVLRVDSRDLRSGRFIAMLKESLARRS